MGFDISQREDGKWVWRCYNSAYGAAGGVADTLAQAKIELAIAEAEMLEHPFPATVKKAMRADPEMFAKDWTDPPYG